MSTQTNLSKFDLITPQFTKNNISFLEALHELEEYFAQGFDKFDLVSCLTGEIVNDYDFIIHTPYNPQTYKLSDIFDLLPYLHHFTSITCNQLIGMPVTLWEKV